MALVAPPPAVSNDPTQRRFRGSAKLTDYEGREKIGEGTFGKVYKATSRRSGKVYALKQILIPQGMEKDGFPITALRELKLLKMMSHPNVLSLDEMAVERETVAKGMQKKRANLYMVTPYMDHDLSGMLTNPDIRFNQAQIKCYMLQLLEGVRYLHDSNIFHRDMKAANILVSNSGILQIADFGLARHYEGQPPQPGRGNGESKRDYTSLVVTRWYRPPELLLVMKNYTPAIDMWGVGCVFAEMFERTAILQGKTDVDQCVQIFRLVGSPTEETMPGWLSLPGCEGHKDWEPKKGDIDSRFGRHLPPEGLDLLKAMLRLDYRKRINALDAIQHDYFKSAPLPARASDLPKYAHSHELDSRRRGQEQRHAPPPAPAGGTVGMGPDEHYDHYPNAGYNYPNDRHPRAPYARDRGPPGAPPNRPYHNDRRDPPPNRAPQWREDVRDRGRLPSAAVNGHGHALPPRPTDPLPSHRGDPGPPHRNNPPPAVAAAARGANIDTYIPNYDRATAPRRPDTGGDDYRARREGSYRDADAAAQQPPPPGRGYRDDRAPPPPLRDGRSYRDADAAPPLPPGYVAQRRTRSRSPEREQDRRERLRDREREFYRR